MSTNIEKREMKINVIYLQRNKYLKVENNMMYTSI